MTDVNKGKINTTTFKAAQTLFQAYSILQTNDILENTLITTLDLLNLAAAEYDDIREIYNNIILKNYPNELSVKSNFINHILFKSNNHVAIFELPIGNSRIDLCKINGASAAFEIKTDLDNLSRLDKQLSDYFEIFEKVFVICSLNRLPEIEKMVFSSCGIYTYSISKDGSYKFQLSKQATMSKVLNAKKQLDIFRKRELIQHFKVSPQLNREEIISLILTRYSVKQINLIFKNTMKSRYKEQWDFLKNHKAKIYEIDYQWFFKNTVNPELVYS